ncbi:EAL domain-containing response regulator [Pseudanabaena sp. FACHB-1998]|uniref:two-component system response regulator n=1 Tax=Pseudanabaena sp. FACHB-1998 TaxID=2692858 RepID=UPI001681BC5B|nr:EAL domain-containing response regulator [Pseudanabaena sp. FACHB-1998]MBD2176277.1 EAL domain-containing response regulator [Pseudanabaena sp. FACHB-1998]
MSKDKSTILIVDDTEFNLKLLSHMLGNQGYKILEATNGFSAINLADTHIPNLILLDIKMPDMDGFEVCTILRNNSKTQEIPIVFISGIDNAEEKLEAFSVGGIDFINKPFHPVEVLARVEVHLRVASLQAELLEQTRLLESQNISLQQEISHLTGFDWNLYLELKSALINEELVLEYQPIVNFKTNLITGFEALIRWNHPQRGLLQPSEFIDLVETTDLINPIGIWVIKTACKQLQIWKKYFPKYKDLTISVNVSTKQLIGFNLVKDVSKILVDYEINPNCLKIEITESAVMGDRDRTLQILHQLKELGIQFCIDDFGTGYSSLRRLTDFPIDVLKIDRSFIVKKEWVIVKAIASLAFTLGKTVIIEGIETDEQLKLLKELFASSLSECYGQGYLFAKSLNAEAASNLLESNTTHICLERYSNGINNIFSQ